MPRTTRRLLSLLLLSPLAACLTDPFGVKPEVPGVEIPDRRTVPAGRVPEADVPDAKVPEVRR